MTATAFETPADRAAQCIASDTFRWDGMRWRAETNGMTPDAMRRHLARTFPLWAEDAATLSAGGTFTVHGKDDRRYTVVHSNGRSRLYRQCPETYTVEFGKSVS